MAVYLKGLDGVEKRLTGNEVYARFTDETAFNSGVRYIAKFLGMEKPDKKILGQWNQAANKFAYLTTPKFTLDFSTRADTEVMHRELCDEIIKGYPEGKDLAQARQVVVQREQAAKQASEKAQEAARQDYNHILDATAQDHYGVKLKKLIEGGWVTLGTPKNDGGYMSKTEKQTYRKAQTTIHQASFGVTRPIEGTIPNEHPEEDRLDLHEHCTYTGAIQVASIQKKAEAGFEGIVKRWLEKDSLRYFHSPAITRQKLFGNG